jgi:hypothetical protein
MNEKSTFSNTNTSDSKMEQNFIKSLFNLCFLKIRKSLNILEENLRLENKIESKT